MSAVLDRTIVSVALDKIKADARAQPRDHINMTVAAEYTEDMALGAAFPPLVVFFDGATYWLADGFHRHYAAKGAELTEFPCDVHAGGIREAVLYSCGANSDHGYKRSNADKRRAVARMLSDELISTDENGNPWSDREIARRCRVGHPLVAQLRSELFPDASGRNSSYNRTANRGGSTYTMTTKSINEGREKPSDASWSPQDIPTKPSDNNGTDEAWKIFRKAEIENAYIYHAYRHVSEEFDKLPSPEEAAQNMPKGIAYTIQSARARQIADWFSRFAEEWDRRNAGT